MKINKNILMPSIIAIITLLILVAGATYAYYNVQFVDSSRTVTGTATFPAMGSVAIASGSNLSLNLTRPLLMKLGRDETYYATTDGTPTTTASSPTIGTVTVVGNGTFSCDYTINVSMTGTLYNAFNTMASKSSGQIVLSINGKDYDFYDSTNLTSFNVPGHMTGLTSNNPQYITAQLRFVNKNTVDQNALVDKNVTFTFAIDDFRCEANF